MPPTQVETFANHDFRVVEVPNESIESIRYPWAQDGIDYFSELVISWLMAFSHNAADVPQHDFDTITKKNISVGDGNFGISLD